MISCVSALLFVCPDMQAMRRSSGRRDLNQAGFSEEAKKWVICGDDLTNDVMPAKELGMLAVWVSFVLFPLL